MHTPPSTPLKSDLELELKKVRDEISKEKAALEQVQRDRSSAEENFAAREKKCIDREEEAQTTLNKFAADILEKELHIKKIDTRIASANEDCSNIVAMVNNHNSIYAKLKDAALEELAGLYKQIDSLKATAGTLASDISDKQSVYDAESSHIAFIISQIKKLSAKMQAAYTELSNREKIVSDKEKTFEKRKSDFRIISARLHEKYGHLMNKNESVSTSIE